MNLDTTEVLTRFILRNDVIAEWETSTLILMRGEPAVEIDLEAQTGRIKIGDGKSTFNQLPYSTATPDDIQKMIDKSIAAAGGGSGGDISSISLIPGTANGTIKLVVNGVESNDVAITGLGSAAYTNADAYATAEQGVRADKAMVFKGFAATLPAGDHTIGDTYVAAKDMTITASLSESGMDTLVYDGDLIIFNEDHKWVCIHTGGTNEGSDTAKFAEVAKRLETGISATMTGGIEGSASVANAGEAIEISVNKVNTDYLSNGIKTLVLNGGSASN